ncbi:MAG: zinc dependent phospholipase C family protein [Candidatus Promineifilaceae bacterium]|nr:zinc dependent phospholipase C family protein [Candidatus Promineifilaceae bacterium]
MPTPFMHLQVAEQIRAHPDLPAEVAACLDAHWPAFYLGNVAADFQTISATPREVAHFYRLPPTPGVEAYEEMLRRHPELASSAHLASAHAVFIAGYLAHLLLDLRWYWEVLVPYFVEAEGWPADHRERFLAHNILLTYLDNLASGSLPADAGAILAQAQPHRWLPFAGDGDLIRWRDMLSDQLRPGATTKTILIYAGRMNMAPDALKERLDDAEWMEEQVFRRVPLEAVQDTLTKGVESSVQLVKHYLSGAPIT